MLVAVGAEAVASVAGGDDLARSSLGAALAVRENRICVCCKEESRTPEERRKRTHLYVVAGSPDAHTKPVDASDRDKGVMVAKRPMQRFPFILYSETK